MGLEAIHVTLPVKEPVKITAGRPSVPLPMIWKVLPELLNVPPVVRLPEVNAPVVKLTLPHGVAVEHVPDPRPITVVRLDPLRVSPALLPAKVPPVLPKSTLPAKAATGKARASKAIKTIRFMIKSLLNLRSKTVKIFGDFRPPLAEPNSASHCRSSILRAKLGKNVTC